MSYNPRIDEVERDADKLASIVSSLSSAISGIVSPVSYNETGTYDEETGEISTSLTTAKVQEVYATGGTIKLVRNNETNNKLIDVFHCVGYSKYKALNITTESFIFACSRIDESDPSTFDTFTLTYASHGSNTPECYYNELFLTSYT